MAFFTLGPNNFLSTNTLTQTSSPPRLNSSTLRVLYLYFLLLYIEKEVSVFVAFGAIVVVYLLGW